MKRFIIILSVLMTICLLLIIVSRSGRTECVCSILSDHESRHPITPLLDSIWDINSANEGTFIRLLTTCKHGKRIRVTVFSDEGYFVGCIVN